MKLWQKVSVLSISVLILVVAACSTLLLIHAQDSILELTKEQARDQQRNLKTSFLEIVQYYFKDETNSIVKESAVKYCFSRFASESAVLVNADETLYSFVSIKPEVILPLTSQYEQYTFLDEIDSRNILIIGSNVTVLNDEYSVYIVKDVTDVYNSIRALIWQFVIICTISVAVGTLLIVFLVRCASKPLIRLKDTTRRIAVGEYNVRAEISSKDEVGELAIDFNDMAGAVQTHIARLEDTAQRQRLFIGALTHEFKTPLTSMIIHTDTLLTANLNDEEAENSLFHLYGQCRWLERLTQKLLKLITLEQDIHVRPENIRELFEDVCDSTAETLKERNTPLNAECNIEILELDYDLMKSLLINIIDNASKASESGQEITLKAYGSTIEVTDYGKGIPKDEIARVTDAFYMADGSRSKKNGGSGLGLALVKHIVDAHHAELIIESGIATGTIVKVIFPVNQLR